LSTLIDEPSAPARDHRDICEAATLALNPPVKSEICFEPARALSFSL
jgi:hypothetical protein